MQVFKLNKPSTCGRPPFHSTSEDSCIIRSSQRKDPTKCEFGSCPWEIFLDDPELYRIYQFCRQALRHDVKKRKGKKEEHVYSVLYLQDFEAFCRLHMIRPEKRLEALSWAMLVADAAQEAVGRPKEADEE